MSEEKPGTVDLIRQFKTQMDDALVELMAHANQATPSAWNKYPDGGPALPDGALIIVWGDSARGPNYIIARRDGLRWVRDGAKRVPDPFHCQFWCHLPPPPPTTKE